MFRHYLGVLVVAVSVLGLVSCEGGGSNEASDTSAVKSEIPPPTAAQQNAGESQQPQATFDTSLTIDLTGIPSTSGDQASYSILGHGDFSVGDASVEVYCIVVSGM